jgi:hypothetical protein
MEKLNKLQKVNLNDKAPIVMGPLDRWMGDSKILMDGLPNGILNKVDTGCGGSWVAMNNTEPTVLLVPLVDIAIQKAKDAKGRSGVLKLAVHGPRTEEGLKAVGEFEIEKYVTLMKFTQQPIKIAVVYDSFPKVHNVLVRLGLEDSIRYVVDEWHGILEKHRNPAIRTMLSLLKSKSKVTWLSATPLKDEMLPTYYEGMDYTEVIWPNLIRIKPRLTKTNKPFLAIVNVLTNYHLKGINGNGVNVTCFDGTVFESKSIMVYVNSVLEIKSILTKLISEGITLDPKDVNIIVSDNERNNCIINNPINGITYEIGRPTTDYKKYTFVTAKAFEGVDLYSEDAATYVVCNVNKPNTVLPIETTIRQIMGRNRCESNPIRNILHLIFNTDRTGITLAEVEENDKRLCMETEVLMELWKKGGIEKEAIRRLVVKGEKEGFYVYNPLDDTIVYDEVKRLSIYRDNMTLYVTFKDGLSVRNGCKDAGFDVSGTTQTWMPIEGVEKCLVKSPELFKKVWMEYQGLIGNESQEAKYRRIVIEARGEIGALVKEATELGFKEADFDKCQWKLNNIARKVMAKSLSWRPYYYSKIKALKLDPEAKYSFTEDLKPKLIKILKEVGNWFADQVSEEYKSRYVNLVNDVDVGLESLKEVYPNAVVKKHKAEGKQSRVTILGEFKDPFN